MMESFARRPPLPWIASPERMRFIVRERLWKNGNLGEIGAGLAVSGERVRQLLTEAPEATRRM